MVVDIRYILNIDFFAILRLSSFFFPFFCRFHCCNLSNGVNKKKKTNTLRRAETLENFNISVEWFCRDELVSSRHAEASSYSFSYHHHTVCTVSTYTLSIISCATRRPECVTSPLVTGAGRTKTKRIYPMITIIVAGAEVSVYKGGGKDLPWWCPN